MHACMCTCVCVCVCVCRVKVACDEEGQVRAACDKEARVGLRRLVTRKGRVSVRAACKGMSLPVCALPVPDHF